MLEIRKEMVANADNLYSYDFKQLLFALAFASKLLLFLISICFKQMLIFYSSGSVYPLWRATETTYFRKTHL